MTADGAAAMCTFAVIESSKYEISSKTKRYAQDLDPVEKIDTPLVTGRS